MLSWVRGLGLAEDAVVELGQAASQAHDLILAVGGRHIGAPTVRNAAFALYLCRRVGSIQGEGEMTRKLTLVSVVGVAAFYLVIAPAAAADTVNHMGTFVAHAVHQIAKFLRALG